MLPDGTYLGGRIVLAANDAIADFSLEQYRGNVPDAEGDDPNTQFRYNGASLNLYEYARASMSRGAFAFNPVYELQVSMRALCRDAAGKTQGADAHIVKDVATLYADLSQMVAAWERHDHRVVYHGLSLKDALAETYAAQDRACIASGSSDKEGTSPLDRVMRRSPETDVQRLIAQIVEPASFAEMQPVGY